MGAAPATDIMSAMSVEEQFIEMERRAANRPHRWIPHAVIGNCRLSAPWRCGLRTRPVNETCGFDLRIRQIGQTSAQEPAIG